MSIKEIDHRDSIAASMLNDLMQLAYQEEAQLIGAENFPSLHRTVADIQNSEGKFFACDDDGMAVGAIEVEISNEGIQIAIAESKVDACVIAFNG